MQNNKKISLVFVLGLLFVMLTSFTVSLQKEEVQNRERRRKFDYYFYEAIKSNNIGKYAEAFDLFAFCSAIDSTNAEVQFQIGNYFRNLNQPENAIPFLSYAVSCDKDNFSYNLVLASVYEQSGRNSEAIAIYESLIVKQPENMELIFTLAGLYANVGEYQKSIDRTNELEKIIGVSEKLSVNKFKLYNAIGEKDKAHEELEKLVRKFPDDLNYSIALAEVYMHDGKAELARNLLEELLPKNSNSVLVIIPLLFVYNESEDKAKREELFWNSIENKNLDSDSRSLIANRYMSILVEGGANIEQLNGVVEKLLEKNPTESSYLIMSANILLERGKEKEALDILYTITKNDSSNLQAWQGLMDIYARKSDLDKIVETAESAISNRSDVPLFYYYLGGAKYQQGMYDDALKAFNTGLTYIDQNNTSLFSEFYGLIGDLHYREGRKKEAFTNYDLAINYNSSNLSVLNNYSYFLSLDDQDLYKAEQMSAATVKADPDNPTYLDTYGWILFKQKSYELAKTYLEKAISNSPDEPSSEMYEHYGDVLFKTGEEAKALEQWKEAKNRGGDSPVLNKKIAEKKYFEK